MQFLPSTWAHYGLGGDVWNNHDAILGAAHYLAANGAADGTEAGLERAPYRF
jgi:membrane-bound lytic murein transglycosylase B